MLSVKPENPVMGDLSLVYGSSEGQYFDDYQLVNDSRLIERIKTD